MTDRSSDTKTAVLHAIWIGGSSTGYVHSVTYQGEEIVTQSKDTACEAARALLTRGVTGDLRLIDGATGQHRYTVNIEKAARLTIREDRRRGPEFVAYRPHPASKRAQRHASVPYNDDDARPRVPSTERKFDHWYCDDVSRVPETDTA